MSFSLTYKRLLEVRLLHEYYLLGPDALSFFDLPDNDREKLFRKRVAANQYRLQHDVAIEPSEQTRIILKNLGWRFLTTAAGFTLAAKSEPMQLDNGSPAYRPAISPGPGVNLHFILSVRNPLFQNFTSLPLRGPALSAAYYFSNRPVAVNGNGFKTMSVPTAALDPTRWYEMGELAVVNGILQESTGKTEPDPEWSKVEGDGYVNGSDRTALPKKFVYSFAPADGIQSAAFILRAAGGGAEITRVLLNGTQPLSVVEVDLRAGTPPVILAEGPYQLQIDAGPLQETYEIYLTENLRKPAFGLVHINLDETAPDYRILGPNGEIRNLNTDPAGRPIPPTFEIRLRSRRAYWTYQPYLNTRRFEIPPIPTPPPPPSHPSEYLELDGNYLSTIAPQPFSFLGMGIRSPSAGSPVLPLPKAEPNLLRPRPPNRLFTEIRTFKLPGINEVDI